MNKQNISFLSALTKFGIVPAHLILHIFKVFLDDFTGVNIDNAAMLLEGCGRYLMCTEETKDKMVSLVRSTPAVFTVVVPHDTPIQGRVDATQTKRATLGRASGPRTGERLLPGARTSRLILSHSGRR